MRSLKRLILVNSVAVAISISGLGISVVASGDGYPTVVGNQTQADTVKDTPASVSSTMTNKEKSNQFASDAKVATSHRYREIDVVGYTDNTCGSNCVRISTERAHGVANAIQRQLAQDGNRVTRVYFIGRGSVNPIASNATAQGRSANTRVVISYIP